MHAKRTPPLSWLTVATLLAVVPLVGCSDATSDGSPTDPQSTAAEAPDAEASDDTAASNSADADSTGSGDAVDRPSGFPEEIPLPDGATLTQADELGDMGWQLTFDIGDVDAEAAMQAYAGQLESAGFETRAAGGGISATTPTHDIGVSITPPELFLQVTNQLE